MKTATETTITVKTPIPINATTLRYFFQKLDPDLVSHKLTRLLIEGHKVEVESKIFDMFDFSEGVQALANKDLERFIDFLKVDFDRYAARMIFGHIPGFWVEARLEKYLVVRHVQGNRYLLTNKSGNLTNTGSWLRCQDAIAAAKSL